MYKRLFFLSATVLLMAEPASATQGLTCRTASGSPLVLDLVLGAPPAILSPRLAIGGRSVPVAMQQSWSDQGLLWVDLARSAQATERLLRLKVRRNEATFDGHVWYGGTRRWVRCRES